jgi:hypothetical protein
MRLQINQLRTKEDVEGFLLRSRANKDSFADKLSKEELTHIYKILFGTIPKGYMRRLDICRAIWQYHEQIRRAMLLKP